VLRALARSGPVLVAVDDLQWLDIQTVAGLEFVARRLHDKRVHFLLAREGREDRVVRALVDERLQRLELEGLSLGALHRLLAERFEASFSPPLVRHIHEISGGNPFHALELSRAIVRGGGAAPGYPLPVPERLHDLVAQRLAALPGPTRKSLLTAASLEEPKLSVPGLDREAMAPAVQGGVVEIEDERVRFTHPLLATILYAEAASHERREVHRELGRALSAPELRARHLALGAEGPDEEAVQALQAAAEHVAARGAPGAAAELYELAASLSPDRVTAGSCMLKAARSYRHVDHARARALAEALRAELGSGREHAAALFLLGTLTGDIEAAIALAEQALAEAAGDDRLRAEVNSQLASWQLFFSSVHDARRHARAALELSLDADRSTRAEALAQLLLIETCAGERVDQSIVDHAVALEDPSGSPLLFSPSRAAGTRLMYRGQLDEARTLIHAWMEQGAAYGLDVVQASAARQLVVLEVRSGNLDKAGRLALAEPPTEDPVGRARTLFGRALVAAYRGHVDEARAAATEGADCAERAHNEHYRVLNLGVLGSLELSLGQPEAAAKLLVPLVRSLHEVGWGEPAFPAVVPDAIDALVGCGDLEQARQLLVPLEKRARRIESPWALAAAAHCRGLLLLAEGYLDEAVESFERAIAIHGSIQCPIDRARVLLSLGVARRRQRQRRVARLALQLALDTFESVGTLLWEERVREELGRIAGRRAQADELTPTERLVAELVAEGRTNREVAQRLVVAERTVEWNLSKVYRKLGVRSRTELARHFAQIR
jgi:DNA-binding CsgD family transcriptional regulator